WPRQAWPQGHLIDDSGLRRRTVTGMDSQRAGTMTPPSTERSVEESRERTVVMVTFDSGQILDVTGPLEVFSHASRFLPAVFYRTQVATRRGGPVLASCGLEFGSTSISEVTGPVDTLMVGGGAGIDAAVADTE